MGSSSPAAPPPLSDPTYRVGVPSTCQRIGRGQGGTEDLRLVSAERIAPRQSPRLWRPTGLRDPLIPLRRPKRIAGVHLGDHGRVSLKLGPRHGQVFVVETTNSDPSPGQPEGPRN